MTFRDLCSYAIDYKHIFEYNHFKLTYESEELQNEKEVINRNFITISILCWMQ